ncbi:hypothetical protein FA13DRAFT_1787446 [Coprinellus micaceus]|uniref:Uncharacterized protein n=1 Tax=Coprinellus micaceus TaxID=71717 RepID=A0A4Y7TQX6_COPMI|nr:hypothetical protein FA13DRAFT_1787446 [Coprinellus micaceus]
MPRRSPPSALKLVPGPTPERGTPKHTLPTPPRPIHVAPITVRIPRPAAAFSVHVPAKETAIANPRLRGPWDHSSSVRIALDVERMLAPLQPAVVAAGRQPV